MCFIAWGIPFVVVAAAVAAKHKHL